MNVSRETWKRGSIVPTEWIDRLRADAAQFGVELDARAMERFETYAALLIEWNERMNLTAITEPGEIAVKHFADSLSLLGCAELKEGAVVADVGSGAGFPGIPLAIVRPDLRVTCLDSLQKRITFLEEVSRRLGLAVECRHVRAEEAGRMPALREHFDAVTARAVARMALLAEYCLPLVKPGGRFYAMKGPDGGREAAEAASAIETMGGRIRRTVVFTLPGTDMGRAIVVVDKKHATPGKYPRAYATMCKHPLV